MKSITPEEIETGDRLYHYETNEFVVVQAERTWKHGRLHELYVAPIGGIPTEAYAISVDRMSDWSFVAHINIG